MGVTLTPCRNGACNWSRSADAPRGGQTGKGLDHCTEKLGLYAGGQWFPKCDSRTRWRNITWELKKNTNSWVLPGAVLCCAMLSHVWPFETLCSVAQQAPLPRNSSGKKTGVSSHFILQGTFPAQGLNLGPGLLHWQTVSLPCEPPSKALGPPYTHWIRNDEMGPSISCYWGVTYRSQNSLFLSAHVNDFQ